MLMFSRFNDYNVHHLSLQFILRGGDYEYQSNPFNEDISFKINLIVLAKRTEGIKILRTHCLESIHVRTKF